MGGGMETLRYSRCSAVWWESAERTSPGEMPGNLQDHSMRYPRTVLILTGEIRSPLGRCGYSDTRWFSEQEKKKLFVSHHFREQDREQILCRIMMSVHCGLQAPVVCRETDWALEAKVWSCKKRPVVFCWLSVAVPKVKILPKGYFQKHNSTIDYLASRSLIDLALCYWSKKYVYHQFLRYHLPWSWDQLSLRG